MTTSTLGLSSTPKSTTSRCRSESVAVSASMTIVTIAIAAVLFVHGGFTPWAAAAIAAVVGALLLSLHAVVRRVATIETTTAPTHETQAAQDDDHHATPSTRAPSSANATRQRPQWSTSPPTLEDTPAVADTLQHSEVAAANHYDTFAHEHRQHETPADMDPRDRDFQHLQGLIKQLATDVQGHNSRSTASNANIHASHDLPHATPAADATHRPINSQHSWLAEAIAADRVNVYLDPIQGLSERKPRHFEVSVRLLSPSGAEVEQREVMAAARVSGLVPQLDAIKLPRVARIAHRILERGQPSAVLTSMSGESLAEDIFREAASRAIGDGSGGHLVLSYAQHEVRAFGAVHWEALDLLATWGMRFALEDVVDLDMDFSGLKARGFEFVKLDAGVLLDGMPGAGGIVPAADLCRYLAEIGMTLVVGQIDDEWTMARVLGFGILYGQGALFGAPRPVRPDIIEPTRHAA